MARAPQEYVVRFACKKDTLGRCMVPPWEHYYCAMVPRRRLRQVRRDDHGKVVASRSVVICLPRLGIGLADEPIRRDADCWRT